jgi:hypothetical protein
MLFFTVGERPAASINCSYNAHLRLVKIIEEEETKEWPKTTQEQLK